MVFPSAGWGCGNTYLIHPLNWRNAACATLFSWEKDYNYGIRSPSLYLGDVIIACHCAISNKKRCLKQQIAEQEKKNLGAVAGDEPEK